jgi:hypothetical protein
MLLMTAALLTARLTSAIDFREPSFIPVLGSLKNETRQNLSARPVRISEDGKYVIFTSSEFGFTPIEGHLGDRFYLRSVSSGNYSRWAPDQAPEPYSRGSKLNRVITSENVKYALINVSLPYQTGLVFYDIFSGKATNAYVKLPGLATVFEPTAINNDGNRVIARFSDNAGKTQIKICNAGTSPDRTISASNLGSQYNDIQTLAFTKDLKTLVLTATYGFPSVVDIWIYDVDTNTYTKISNPGLLSVSGISSDLRYLFGVTIIDNKLRLKVYDRVAETNRLVNVGPAGEPNGLEKLSGYLSISPNGRYVCFNLSEGGTGIWRKDVVSGALVKISGTTAYSSPLSTANTGRMLMYHAETSNDPVVLATQDDVNGIRNATSATTSAGSTGQSVSRFDGVSADGRFVATLESTGVYLLDRITQSRIVLPYSSPFNVSFREAPWVSADGRYVFYRGKPTGLSEGLYRYKISDGSVVKVTEASTSTPLNMLTVSIDGDSVLLPGRYLRISTGQEVPLPFTRDTMDGAARYYAYLRPKPGDSASTEMCVMDLNDLSVRVFSYSSSPISTFDAFVSRDGSRVIFCGSRKYVFNLNTGAKVFTYPDTYNQAFLGISPNGKAVLIATYDGTLTPPILRMNVIGQSDTIPFLSTYSDPALPLSLRTGPPILINSSYIGKYGTNQLSLLTNWPVSE